jgi:hypothetical protein
MKKIQRLKRVRTWLAIFMVCLFLSGVTAIPVEWQLSQLLKFIPAGNAFYNWIDKVLRAYQEVNQQHPFLLYGYDWLAFAHFVLAILFIGAYKNPLRNIWVIQFGLIACVLILPFAFIAGHFRGIPIGWRLIDCSFGVIGFAVLWYCYRQIQQTFSHHKNRVHESI